MPSGKVTSGPIGNNSPRMACLAKTICNVNILARPARLLFSPLLASLGDGRSHPGAESGCESGRLFWNACVLTGHRFDIPAAPPRCSTGDLLPPAPSTPASPGDCFSAKCRISSWVEPWDVVPALARACWLASQDLRPGCPGPCSAHGVCCQSPRPLPHTERCAVSRPHTHVPYLWPWLGCHFVSRHGLHSGSYFSIIQKSYHALHYSSFYFCSIFTPNCQ